MSWPLRLIESPFSFTPAYVFKEGKTELDLPVVGDLWFAPEILNAEKLPRWCRLAPYYLRTWAGKRAPLFVMLPGGTHFCVDAMAWRDGEPHGDGWKVTGQAPLITLQPSIHIVGSYHGYITDGLIKDDVHGRKYPG